MPYGRRQFLFGAAGLAASYGVLRTLGAKGAGRSEKRTRLILLGTKGGPSGLRKMTQDFFNYEQFDIETRLKDEGGSDPRKMIFVHEFDRSGVVMQNDDVKVASCRVRHPPITQSYAYRFDAKDRSVVISGDTAYAPELATFAKGADVLIHEAMYLPAIEKLIRQNPGSTRLREHLFAAHTSTEDVGR